MVFEKLDLKFDIEKLREHFYKYVRPLESMQQSASFGGWSVLSSDGSYRDGWHMGHRILEQTEGQSPEKIAEAWKKANFKRAREFCKPTEICHGYLQEVMTAIADYKLHPARARITRLTAGGKSAVHRDATDGTYAVRLHVPLITNEECFFNTGGQSAHLVADGSAYLLWVNRIHQVVNGGHEDRYHLIMDVWDYDGVSQHHRFDPEKYK